MIGLALWRFLRRTRWSTLMALAGVALGVTSIVSVHLISVTIAQRLDRLIPTDLAGFSHFLHRQGTNRVSAADYFSLRRQQLSAPRGSQLSRISAMAPLIDEMTLINGVPVRVVGVDLLNPATAVNLRRAGGRSEMASWQGVWVDAGVTDTSGLTVNGRLDSSDGLLVADIGVAQRLLGWHPDRISYIGVKLDDPWAWMKRAGEDLLPGFGAGLPDRSFQAGGLAGYQILSLARQHPASQFGKSVLFNISALGLLAMLVAWFLMYQVAVSWLRRLWPVFERLHVLGVEWRSLQGYFVTAMAGLGLASGLMGLAAGRWLAQWLFSVVVQDIGQAFVLTPAVVWKALLSAGGVCLAGGAWAFRQARRESQASVRWGLAGLLMLAAVGGVSVADTGLVGGFVSIAVLSVMAVLLVTPLLHVMRRYAGYIGGPYLARLSVREAVWYPHDLAVALGGLALAVATAIGVGLMVDSFREDFSRMLERRLSYDVMVQGDERQLQALYTELGQTSSAWREAPLSRVQAYARSVIRLSGVPVELVLSRLDQTEAARYGLNRALQEDEVLLSEQGARMLDVKAGDALGLPQGRVTVAGIFASFGDLQPRLLMQRSGDPSDTGAGVDSLSVNTPQPERFVERVLQSYPDLTVQLQADLRRNALATFDQTFVITTVLILIALLVAGIGVYVAVTTLRLNRRTGVELMHGLGVYRWEDTGMDFALGVGIGVLALALAIPLGCAFGWILCSVINPRAFGWTVALQMNWQSFSGPVLWGLTAAALAGVIRIGRKEGSGLGGRGR